jgi:hypothetical protein
MRGVSKLYDDKVIEMGQTASLTLFLRNAKENLVNLYSLYTEKGIGEAVKIKCMIEAINVDLNFLDELYSQQNSQFQALYVAERSEVTL